MAQELVARRPYTASLATTLGLTACAAGMGWGIRGQFGHETGAMIAGALAAQCLVLFCASHLPAWVGLRAAAWMTIAIGVGGSMTYGQTVGLTHDTPLIGNWEALRWGMLGLAIKGGLWIGFAGLFLGMGLSGTRYRWYELAAVTSLAALAWIVGVWCLNSPYDPAQRILPRIYFSDSWHFEPDADLKPRREVWGGALFALAWLIAYARCVRGDRLAGQLAAWAIAGGMLGFPGGQCVQSFHAWNAEWFTQIPFHETFAYFNWWNMMETTFGLIWGAVLGAGVWIHRDQISTPEQLGPSEVFPWPWEVVLAVVHVVLVLLGEFMDFAPPWTILSSYTDWGLLMAMIPWIAVAGGRYWPAFALYPLVAAPIVGKSLRQHVFEEASMSAAQGWIALVILPLLVMSGLAIYVGRASDHEIVRRRIPVGLIGCVWFYLAINTVFFHFAWPWREWTARTPNQLIFSVCAILVTIGAIVVGRARADEAPSRSLPSS